MSGEALVAAVQVFFLLGIWWRLGTIIDLMKGGKS